MKNNAPRNSIFNCRRPLSVLLLGVVVPHAQVNADVPPPPPVQHQNAGFPSAQKLEQMGYKRETGVWKVQTNPTGKPTVSSGGGQITGTQGQRVTVTDRYGNKATVNTQVTQRVNSGRVEAAIGGTLAGLTAAGGAIGSDFAASAYKNAKEGDWGGFARDSFGAVLEGLSKLDFTGLGGGINQFLDKTGIREGASAGQLNQASAKAAAAQAQAERSGDFRAAVANAAAAKAANAAAEAEKKAEAEKQAEKEANAKGLYRHDIVFEFSNNKNGKYYKNYVAYSTEKNDRAWGRVTVSNISWWHYSNRDSVTFWLGQHFTPQEIEVKVNVPKDTYTEINLRSYPAGSPDIPDAAKNASQVNPSDFLLNQKEMLDILRRMLESNQTNHAELMNQLAKLGNVVPSATTANSFAPATALSAPFTPEGSNVPQQTLFKLDDKGNVTATAIPRPDLKANSSQAPARQPIVPSQTQGQNNVQPAPNAQTGEQTAPSGQQNSPEKEAGGNAPENYDYEDFIIPERTVDLGTLRPVNVFATDGVCPSGVSVQMGVLGTIDFNYDEACRILRLLRPIIILATMITCSMMAYAAVKEL